MTLPVNRHRLAGGGEAALPQPSRAGAASELGWTAVACAGELCCAALAATALDRLSAVVRTSPHAILVSGACPFGGGGCPVAGGLAFGKAVTVVVQPCTALERRPVGLATIVGPIRTEAEIDLVCRWLALGELDPCALPERLRRAGSMVKAPLN